MTPSTHSPTLARARHNKKKSSAAPNRTPKSALATPFQRPWPSISKDLQVIILERLLDLLPFIHIPTKSRKRNKRTPKPDAATSVEEQPAQSNTNTSDSFQEIARSAYVYILEWDSQGVLDYRNVKDKSVSQEKHVIIGINSVTRRLEHQCGRTKEDTGSETSRQATPTLPPISLVVISQELKSSPLLDHIRHLVETCNLLASRLSTGSSTKVLTVVVSDPEEKLAKTLGIKRASLLAFDALTPGLDSILEMLEASSASNASPIPYHTLHVKNAAVQS